MFTTTTTLWTCRPVGFTASNKTNNTLIITDLLVELTVVYKDMFVSVASGDDWTGTPRVVMATVVMLAVDDVTPVNGGSESWS